MSWFFEPLERNAYGLILADPPPPFEAYSELGEAKSPQAQYDTMEIDEICALPVDELAGPDCFLVLWGTWPLLDQSFRFIRAWGFRYVTGGSWTKRTRTFKPCFGPGYVQRSTTEPYLLATCGNPWIGSRSERNLIETIVEGGIDGLRREHSRKPVEMREMCERIAPMVRRCELFAREPWPGADVWGNQVDKFGGAA